MATTSKTAVVVGGSLSGLMTALVLHSLSYSVHVLERNSPQTLQSQAAGIRAGPELHSFIETYVKNFDQNYAITPDAFEMVKQNGELEMKLPPGDPLRLTTWKRVYDMLKGALLEEREDVVRAVYKTNSKVEELKYEGEKVSVIYRDLENDRVESLEADLVIAADGAHSTIRKLVSKDTVTPKYAGYVTWRGRVPESDVSVETREAMQNRCVVMRVGGGYLISYYVPADTVEKTSEREFVWIWYDTIAEDSPTFVETFTDIEGKKHFSTIPRGRIQPQVWQRVLDRKDTVSNPHFIDLLNHTSEPFVSAVRDFPGTKSIFHDGKILLVGDAFALCRPHAGGSTSQAAFQALELRKLLEGQMDFNEWERICVEAAAKESMKSLGAAQFFFTGEMPKFIRDMAAKEKQ